MNPQGTLSWKEYPEIYAVLCDIPLTKTKGEINGNTE